LRHALAMAISVLDAPWLVLGPITGPLAEGVYRNVRADNPGLASLYALATVFTWIDIAIYGGRVVLTLQRWLF
jgi:hypothetical protein